MLAAGANDGTVWLWNTADVAHPALTATLSGLPGHVFSVGFAPDGRQLAAASYDDDTVRLWDSQPGRRPRRGLRQPGAAAHRGGVGQPRPGRAVPPAVRVTRPGRRRGRARAPGARRAGPGAPAVR